MIKSRLLVFFCLLSSTVVAQSFFLQKIEGQIVSDDGDVSGTTVLNSTSNRGTITDADGFFKISAKINDTIVFSAIQFKRREIIVTQAILDEPLLKVVLQESLTELDEVIVRPYNLTGDILKDIAVLKTDVVVTSSTLGLPNAYVKPVTKAERELFAATANPFMSFDPLINAISGRTKMLKKRVARNKKYAQTEEVKTFYSDSLFLNRLKIPANHLDDFLYYCEVDSIFQNMVEKGDKLKLWQYLTDRSIIYRKNNALD